MEPIIDVLQETMREIEARYVGDKEIQGITTDYRELDKVTSGLQRGDLVIIAGRPSMGKTALALNIAQYAFKEAVVRAKTLECRAAESRKDSRPMLSDLRESGSIEQDADMVIFPYREEYYDRELREENKDNETEIMEIILGKNRNGETRSINLGWIGKYQRVVGIV
ncbi:MAG: DnaB-like helicase C-terminal domain-containing protein [Clostridium sp.]